MFISYIYHISTICTQFHYMPLVFEIKCCRVLDFKIYKTVKKIKTLRCVQGWMLFYYLPTLFFWYFSYISILFLLIYYQVHQLFMYRVCLFKVKPSFFEVAMTCVQRLMLINRVHFFTKNSKSVNLFSFCCVEFEARLCVIYFGRLIKKI